jgi:hypothetical protein
MGSGSVEPEDGEAFTGIEAAGACSARIRDPGRIRM